MSGELRYTAFQRFHDELRRNKNDISKLKTRQALISTGSKIITTGTQVIHGLLSSFHTDTVPSGPLRGALIVGNSTPKWERKVLGTSGQVATSDGDDLVWSSALSLASVSINQPTLGNPVATFTSNSGPGFFLAQDIANTTDATPTNVMTYAVLPNYLFHLEVTVIARRTGGTAGTAEDAAAYRLIGSVKNLSGTATVVDAVAKLYEVEDQAGWDASIVVSGGNVHVQVTGAVDNDITWHVHANVYAVSS